ncbi:unnamed protein product [Amoebophrya sp. A120]|nr:unnamed protein product [Amoebophrya sp. A120]|eukprot:GSA120T00019174001.1
MDEAQNQQGRKRLHFRAIIGDAKSLSLSVQRRIMLEVACCLANLWSCDKRSTTMLLYAPRRKNENIIGCATDEHNFKSRTNYDYFQYCSLSLFSSTDTDITFLCLRIFTIFLFLIFRSKVSKVSLSIVAYLHC